MDLGSSPFGKLIDATQVQVLDKYGALLVPTLTGSPILFENREQNGIEIPGFWGGKAGVPLVAKHRQIGHTPRVAWGKPRNDKAN